jgi:CheY-specific phosphatase CheX
MAKQTINIGATANDGSGDPLRTAFDKINDNFTEVYTVSGAGTGNNLAFSGNKIISEDSGGNIELDPQGTGKVIIATAAKLRFTDHVDNAIPYVDASGDVQFKNTLTFDGTEFVAGTAKISNLSAGRVVFVGGDGGLLDSSGFTFDGTTLTVNGITLSGTGALQLDDLNFSDNTITTTASNANLVLLTSGTGIVELDSNMDMNSNKIVNVTDPTSVQDAATKAYVDQFTTVADESTDTTCFPVFATAATGTFLPKTGTNLTFNSNTGLLTATLLAGALTGNVTGTASIATSVTVADESSDTTCFPLFATAATGNLPPKSGSNLTFNSNTGLLTATLLAGALTGNVTGTASIATTVTVTDNESTNEANVILFAAGAAGSGNLGVEADGNMTYNPSTGVITATGFAGALTGNVTGTASIATAVTVTDNESTNEANVILFAAGAAGSGNINVEADGNMTYNPSTGVITATGFAGALTGNVTGTSSIATAVTVADESSDTTCFPTFVTAATGNLPPKTGTNLTFNSSSGLLTAGALTTTGAATIGSLVGGTVATEHGAGAIATSFAPITRRYTQNGVIITKIHFDLTALGGKGGHANDVIGLPAGGNAFIGRNVVSNNGIVYRAELACIELAAAASGSATVDIDIATNSSGTLAYDGAAGTAKLFNTGGMVAGQELSNITPAITANDYFYLVEADTAATDGVYNAGQFILTLYGHAIS